VKAAELSRPARGGYLADKINKSETRKLESFTKA
jgi:hypothetical protein